MQVDDDPLHIEDAHYVELVECLVVEATEGPNEIKEVVTKLEYAGKIKVAYPYAKSELIYLLNRYKLKDYEVMMCPRCNAVFNKKATEGLENTKPHPSMAVVGTIEDQTSLSTKEMYPIGYKIWPQAKEEVEDAVTPLHQRLCSVMGLRSGGRNEELISRLWCFRVM